MATYTQDFWQNTDRSEFFGKRQNYFTLPAFSVGYFSWLGASYVVAQFNYTASNNFTLRNLPEAPEGCTFIPCIRYRIGETVYRYSLWSGLGEVLYVPPYVNQRILKNFTIEIWNVESVNECILESDLMIPCSILTPKAALTDADIVAQGSGVLVGLGDLQVGLIQ